MRLYDIAAEYEQLLKMVEREELTEEMISDTLESIEAEFNAKALNCMNVVSELNKELAGIDVHINRLKALEKQVESSRDNLIEYVKNSILSIGKDSLNLGLYKLSIRAATKQLPAEINESLVDDKFFIVVPESKRIDRRALLAEVKINPIAGIELVDSKRSLTIK